MAVRMDVAHLSHQKAANNKGTEQSSARAARTDAGRCNRQPTHSGSAPLFSFSLLSCKNAA